MIPSLHLKRLNCIVIFSLAIFLFLIPVSIKYSNIAFAISFIPFIISRLWFSKEFPKIDKRSLFYLGSSTAIIYLFVIVSLLYSESMSETFKFVEYRLPLLLFPLMFFFGLRLTPRQREIIFAGFVAGALAKVLYYCGLSIYGLSEGTISFNNLTYSPINNLNTIFKDHRTYLSFYALMALVIIVGSRVLRYPLWFKIVSGVIILTTIFSFESRALIGISLALAIVFPFCFAKRGKIIKVAAITYCVLLASMVIPYTSGSYRLAKERMTESSYELNSEVIANQPIPATTTTTTTSPIITPDSLVETPPPLQVETRSYDSRASRWKVALEAISERPLIGYGSGSEKDVLTPRYIEKGMEWSAVQKLDVHNQFLSFALENGVLAAIFYIYMLAFIFFKGVKKRDIIIVFFVTTCGAMSLFENILNVSWMITFFAFMSSAIIFQRDDTKESI